MPNTDVLLTMFAFVLFALSTLGVQDAPNFRLVPAGLACLVLTLLT